MLHVGADGAAPPIVDHPAVTGARSYDRVADYAHAAPGGRRWLTIHDLVGCLDGHPAVDAGALVALAHRAAPGDVVATVFEQISPAGGWLTGDGVVTAGELPAGTAVLSVVMDVAEAGLDVFHGWYDEEHLPKLVAVPGIDAARRFRAVAGDRAEPGRHRFLALYELGGLDFLASPEWAEAASMTPRTAEVVPHVQLMNQLYRLAR